MLPLHHRDRSLCWDSNPDPFFSREVTLIIHHRKENGREQASTVFFNQIEVTVPKHHDQSVSTREQANSEMSFRSEDCGSTN